MGASEIKTELQQLIEQETDMSILHAIHTILLKTGLNPKLKEKLTIRALKSEEDIKANRVFSKEEVIQRTNR
jgi:predicted transposase YdaD